MTISELENSLFYLLYNNFEVLSGIKIFESVYHVDFKSFDKWIVIDSMSHTTGSYPKAVFYLHISIKNGLLNDKVVLNKLVDDVTAVIFPMARFDLLDSDAQVVSEAEITDTSLLPVVLHAGGGSYRSLGVEIAYPGQQFL